MKNLHTQLAALLLSTLCLLTGAFGQLGVIGAAASTAGAGVYDSATTGSLIGKFGGSSSKVPWHQDCVIAVAERREVLNWGPLVSQGRGTPCSP
jgi:hypothetical protein